MSEFERFLPVSAMIGIVTMLITGFTPAGVIFVGTIVYYFYLKAQRRR